MIILVDLIMYKYRLQKVQLMASGTLVDCQVIRCRDEMRGGERHRSPLLPIMGSLGLLWLLDE